MTKTSSMASIAAIGLDVGDRFTHLCAVDERGEVVDEPRLATRPEDLSAYFAGKPRCVVILEVGTHSPWISRLIERLGQEVIVANSRRVRLIAESDQKSDRIDARMLAELGRTRSKLLKTVKHRSEQAQADLTQLRSRELRRDGDPHHRSQARAGRKRALPRDRASEPGRWHRSGDVARLYADDRGSQALQKESSGRCLLRSHAEATRLGKHA